MLDQVSSERFRKTFIDLSPEQKGSLLSDRATQETAPQGLGEKFFVQAKQYVAVGFYTSKVGLIDDLKYKGNTVTQRPATCEDHFGKGRASNTHSVPGSDEECDHSLSHGTTGAPSRKASGLSPLLSCQEANPTPSGICRRSRRKNTTSALSAQEPQVA